MTKPEIIEQTTERILNEFGYELTEIYDQKQMSLRIKHMFHIKTYLQQMIQEVLTNQ